MKKKGKKSKKKKKKKEKRYTVKGLLHVYLVSKKRKKA